MAESKAALKPVSALHRIISSLVSFLFLINQISSPLWALTPLTPENRQQAVKEISQVQWSPMTGSMTDTSTSTNFLQPKALSTASSTATQTATKSQTSTSTSAGTISAPALPAQTENATARASVMTRTTRSSKSQAADSGIITSTFGTISGPASSSSDPAPASATPAVSTSQLSSEAPVSPSEIRPRVSLQAATPSVTVLPGTPSVGFFNSSSANNQPNATGSIEQFSSSEFRINYDISNNGSFAGAYIAFSNDKLFDFMKLSSLDVKFRTNNICTGGCLYMEMKDDAGKVAKFRIPELDGIYQKISIPRSFVQQVNPEINLARVKEIVFLVDRTPALDNQKTVGYLDVRIGGLAYTSFVQGTNFDSSALTQLTGSPTISSSRGAINNQLPNPRTGITVNQTSSSDLSMTYTVANPNDFAYAQIHYGFKQDGSFLSTQAYNQLTLALKADHDAKAVVEFIDAVGKKAIFNVQLGPTIKNYTFNLTEAPDFDETKVGAMNIVFDNTKSGLTGTVTLQTKGLAFIPLFPGATYNPALLSTLNHQPTVGGFSGSTLGSDKAHGQLQMNQTSAENFSFRYSFPADGDNVKDDFNVAQISAGVLSTAATATITQIPSPLNQYEIKIQGGGAVISYNILYKDSITGPWKTAVSKLPADPSSITQWKDDGSFTGSHPRTVSSRFYSVQVAESRPSGFQGNPINVGSQFTLALTGTQGAEGKQAKVEFIDVNNEIALFHVVLSSTKKNYSFNLTGEGVPTGFDFTKVAYINLVTDEELSGTGGLVEVETRGLNFTPVLPGNPYNAAALTTLPGKPEVSGAKGAVGNNVVNPNTRVAINQTSNKDFSIDYTLGSPNDFAYGQVHYGFNEDGSFKNEQSLSSVTLALSSNAARQAVVEFISDTNPQQKARFIVTLDPTKKNYTFDLMSVPNFDETKVGAINIVLDKKSGSSGIVNMELKGLAYIPVLIKTTQEVTDFGAVRPVVNTLEPCAVKDQNPCRITLDTVSAAGVAQLSADEFRFHYDLASGTDAGRFAGSFIDFGNEAKNQWDASSGLVLAIRGTGTNRVKVEIEDAQKKKVVTYADITASYGHYFIPAGLLSEIDSGHIKVISVVVDDIVSKDKLAAGDIFVHVKGLSYTPVFPGAATGNLTDLSAYQTSPGILNEAGGVTKAGSLTFTTDRLNLAYDRRNSTHYGGAIIVLGKDTNEDKALDVFANVTSSPLIFKANGVKRLHVDVSDNVVVGTNPDGSNQYRSVKLEFTGLDQNGFIVIDAAKLRLAQSDFHVNAISSVSFVIDQATDPQNGTLAIDTKGLFVAPVVPLLGTTAREVSNFGSVRPVVNALEPCAVKDQNPCAGTLDTVSAPGVVQLSQDEFRFHYDLNAGTTAGRFAGAFIDFGTEASKLADASEGIVLGIRGTGTNRIKVEIEDTQKNKVVTYADISNLYNNYLIPKELLAGIDYLHIKVISVVVDDQVAKSKTASGDIFVHVNGLLYTPTILPGVYNANAITTLPGKPEVSGAKGAVGNNVVNPNTRVAINQTSNKDFSIDYTLGSPNDFAYGQVHYGFNADGTFAREQSLNSVTMALSSLGERRVVVEFISDTVPQQKAQFIVIVDGNKRNYTFDLASAPNFDETRVGAINIVLNDRSSQSNHGSINVELKGLAYIPVLGKTSQNVSSFGAVRPVVNALEPCQVKDQSPCLVTLDTVSESGLVQLSADEFRFHYDLSKGSAAGRFAGAFIDFGAEPKNQWDGSQGIVLGIRGTGTTRVKVEIEDALKSKVVTYADISNLYNNYFIPANLLTGIDTSHIKVISVVVDDTAAGSKTANGDIFVHVNGLSFVPVFPGVANGVVTDLTPYQAAPGILNDAGGVTKAGSLSYTSEQINLVYDRRGSTQYGGAIVVIGKDTNEDKALDVFANLSSTPLVFKVNGVKRLHVDVSDDVVVGKNPDGTNQYRSVKLEFTGLDQNGFIVIDQAKLLAARSDFHVNAVSSVSFVIDQTTEPQNGTLAIGTKGLFIAPVVPVLPKVAGIDVSDFGALRPAVNTLEPCTILNQEPCTTGTLDTVPGDLGQTSANEFNFKFDLRNGTDNAATKDFRRFGGAFIDFGADASNQLNASAGIVLGIRGTGTTRVKVEVEDAAKKKLVTYVDIQGTYNHYQISGDLLRASGIDVTHVKVITVVIDDGAAGNKTANGEISVNVKGLSYVPVFPGVPTGFLTDLSIYGTVPGILNEASGVTRSGSLSYTSDRVNIIYDRRASTNYGGAILILGRDLDSDKVFDIFANFSTTPLVFKVSGGVKRLHVDVSDDVVVGKNPDGTNQFRSVKLEFTGLDQNGFMVIDAAKLKQAFADFHANTVSSVSFVIDEATEPQNGILTVETRGLFVPPVIPVLGDTGAPVTDFSTQRPVVNALEPCRVNGQDPCVSGTLDTVTEEVVQTSADQFQFKYNLTEGSDGVGDFRRFGGAFIDFGTDASKQLNATGGIVLGIRGTGTPRVKVEVEDALSRKVTTYANIDNITSNYLIPASLLTGIDASHIKVITVVVDDVVSGSKTARGDIFVQTKGLSYVPVFPGVANAVVTDLSNYQIVPGILNEAGGVTRPGSLGYTSDQINLVYDRRESTNYGGTILVLGKDTNDDKGLDVFANLMGTALIFKASGVNRFHVDISDDVVIGKNPDGTNQYRSVKLEFTGLNQNGFIVIDQAKLLAARSDFHVNAVSSVSFVIDQVTDPQAGTLLVETSGLFVAPVIPVIQGTSYNFSAITILPGKPEVGGNKGAVGNNTVNPNTSITVGQDSTREFFINYRLASINDFVYGQIHYGFNADGTFKNEQNLSQVTLALSSDVSRRAKVEFIDDAIPQRKGEFFVQIDTTKKNYTFDLTSIPNFDEARVGAINIVLDRASGDQGTVNVEIGGLAFTPVLNETGANVSDFTSQRPGIGALEPCSINGQNPCIAGTLDTVTSFEQLSADELKFSFDLSKGIEGTSFRGFAGALINFGTDPSKQLNASNGIVLAMKGTGTSRVKVEIEDASGTKVIVHANIDGTYSNYLIPTSLLTGVDISHIRSLAVVVDDVVSGSKTAVGDISVRAKGFAYVPVIEGQAGRSVSDLSSFNVSPGPLNALSGVLTSAIKLTGTTEFSFDYAVKEGTFGGAILVLGSDTNADKVFDRFYDASGGKELIFGVEGVSRIRISVSDDVVSGQNPDGTPQFRSTELEYLLGSNNKYVVINESVLRQALSEFHTDKITSVSFVVESHTQPKNGSVKVLSQGLLNIPPVVGVDGSEFNESLLTQLSNNEAVLSGNTGPNPEMARLNLDQLSPDEFRMESHIDQANGFTFAVVSPGYFDEAKVYQGITMNPGSSITVAARGSEGGKLKVEVVDKNNLKAIYYLNLKPYYQNYTVNLSGAAAPAGFDTTNIAQLVYVQDTPSIGNAFSSVVKVFTKGVKYAPVLNIQAHRDVRERLINAGLSYFEIGKGVDPTTHLPYDRTDVNGIFTEDFRFTQPTLIGFYLQMLGDAAAQNTVWQTSSGVRSTDELLGEMEAVLNTLLMLQDNPQVNYRGLLSFIDLKNPSAPSRFGSTVGLGDNANLIQSMAVMSGTLDRISLTPDQRTKALAIQQKVENFMNAQEAGYRSFVRNGLLAGAYDMPGKNLVDYNNDRLMTEFRGAIAFLRTRYPSAIPQSAWDGLRVTTRNYTDRSGNTIPNLQAFEASAFQYFWPLLRNNELDYAAFNNALHNALASHADFAAENRLPGFLSPSLTINNGYDGKIGLKEIAETSDLLISDLGSTYALASAFLVDQGRIDVKTQTVNNSVILEWLNQIEDQLGTAFIGSYGFGDSARSKTELNRSFVGIDVASTVLGLTAKGPQGFDTYLRTHGLEKNYNSLYDQKSRQWVGQIAKTTAPVATAPIFVERSLSVFENFTIDGRIGGFPQVSTIPGGVRFRYGALDNGLGGKFWELNQTYDARNHELAILYSVRDTPQQIVIELKDANDALLYREVRVLRSDPSITRLVLKLPNSTNLQRVKKVFVVVDQNATGDRSGDFTLHAMNFQGAAAPVEITPKPGDSTMVLDLPGDPRVESAGSGTVSQSATRATLNYNLQSSDSAGIVLNFDPEGDGTGSDFSSLRRFIFGLSSTSAHKVHMMIEDGEGRSMAFSLTQVSSEPQYYQFTVPQDPSKLNTKNIKRILFVVTPGDLSGGTSGTLDLEIGI